MRLAAFSLAAGLSAALMAAEAASAQTAAPLGFMPMSNSMPSFLFAPAPLAGSMLEPLTEPAAVSPAATLASDAQPVVAQADPAPDAAAAVEEPEATASVEPEPDAAAEPEVAPEPAPPPPPPAPKLGVVHVIVENVQVASGNVNVALCDKSLSREGCPYTREVSAQQGFVQAEFDDIPPGIYAVVGYHDVNGNQEFDKTLGIPREPYALSARAADKMVPTFKDAALTINPGENSVVIRLKKLGG